jgi:hypothetical protein
LSALGGLILVLAANQIQSALFLIETIFYLSINQYKMNL